MDSVESEHTNSFMIMVWLIVPVGNISGLVGSRLKPLSVSQRAGDKQAVCWTCEEYGKRHPFTFGGLIHFILKYTLK
jgi:hypothetical protein